MTRNDKIAQSAAMIAIFTLISKGLGFLREVFIASKFGSGMLTDTYFTAMTATVIIMRSLGGALNTTLIPIFSEIKQNSGREAQKRYLTNILNLVFIITLVLAGISYFASPLIIKILAKGFQGDQFDLAVKLNRIGLPIVILLGFTYVLSGYLQSNQIFGPHAIMGIPYNLIFIVYLLFLSKNANINGLMIVSVIAALSQVLIQVPATIHTGYSYTPSINLKDPYFYKAMGLVMPVLIGSAVHQINVIVDRTLASELVEGSISALNYSARMNEMVISVFVAAITTVVFPMLSQAFTENNKAELKKIFNRSTNIILLITVPATVGIIILAKPMVRLFFERNAFSPEATVMTAGALMFYSMGLVGSSLRLMLNKVFYSFQDTVTPMINGAISVMINVILNLILIRKMNHNGLALATSISATITTILLFIDLRKKIGRIGIRRIIITFMKCLISATIMGVAVYLTYFKLGSYLPDRKLIDIIMLLVSVGLGVIVYFGLCLVLKVKELRDLMKRTIGEQ